MNTDNLERLRNGAFVLESKDDVVLAYWPDTPMPRVVWRRDAEDKSSVWDGSHFSDLTEAVAKSLHAEHCASYASTAGTMSWNLMARSGRIHLSTLSSAAAPSAVNGQIIGLRSSS